MRDNLDDHHVSWLLRAKYCRKHEFGFTCFAYAELNRDMFFFGAPFSKR